MKYSYRYIITTRRKFFIQKYLSQVRKVKVLCVNILYLIKNIYIIYNLYYILLIFSFLRLIDILRLIDK